MATKSLNEKNKKEENFGKQKRKNNSNVSDNQIISSKAKTDILAVSLIVIGIALLTVSLIPTEAPVSAFIVNVLRFIGGIGVYIFPVILVILGGSFFFRMEKQKISIRVSIGLSIIFVAILTIVSLTTSAVASNKPEGLFEFNNIISYGGIIGSSIAWLGVTLFGNTVTLIIMIGLIVAGLIVIGLSITTIVSRINERREDIERENEERRRQKLISEFANNKDDQNEETLSIDQNAKKTVAMFDNAGKKPGLKTRILGFKNQDIDDNINFDPQQNKTRKISSNKDAESKDKIIKKDSSNKKNESNKKTQVIEKNNVASPKPMDGFVLPSFDILKAPSLTDTVKQSESSLRNTASKLKETLEDFGIKADVVGWVPGPTVTLFKVDLPSGVRVSRITALNDDIALSLAAPGVRVFAPIPGTTYVGIEIPNEKRQTVLLSEILSKAKTGPLQMAIGKDVEGNAIVTNLASMPHLLIGGTTGSGKSVSINAMIMSILMRSTPSEVRMILIDPKRVEFTPYDGIPHLYVPVVTEPKEAAGALAWGVAEMERRLKLLSEHKVRNIGAYNSMVQKLDEATRDARDLEELPYIVIVIDELADLMMAVGKEVEFSISRIAQLARAAGIHLIVATQRPSTNVVTGLIKANITCRIAFNVASGIDSRVILDTGGAESLIGLGDLLFNKPEFSKPLRIQACYVDEDEISAVVEHLKQQGEPEYHNDILKTNLVTSLDSGNNSGLGSSGSSDDTIFWEAAEMIVNAQHGSTSSLQRRFKIGYARAGRIMDMLEEKGIVGPQNGSKPREVLLDKTELEQLKAFENDSSSFDSENALNREKGDKANSTSESIDNLELIEDDIE